MEPYANNGASGRSCIDHLRGIIKYDADGNRRSDEEGYNSATGSMLYSAYRGTKFGVEANRLKDFTDWIQQAWPGSATAADMVAGVPTISARTDKDVTIRFTCQNKGNGKYAESDGAAINPVCGLGVTGMPREAVAALTRCDRAMGNNAKLAAGASINCTATLPRPATNALSVTTYANSWSFDLFPKDGKVTTNLRLN